MRRSLFSSRYRCDFSRWLPPSINLPKDPGSVLAPGVVTVVVSTFNRPEVLLLALSSLRAQTYEHWHAAVVGDACSADTEQVVASMGDPRFSFHNLRENFGDQSMPNSIGARIARTEYLAFLNHDDLWYANHLELMINFLKEATADLVLAKWQRISYFDNTTSKVTVDPHVITNRLSYSPARDWVPVASTWLMRTAIAHEVGDWKPASKVRFASSQDFLYRCWSTGARIVHSTSEPTVVVVPSPLVRKSYDQDESMLHQFLYQRFIATGQPLPLPVVYRTEAQLPSRVHVMASVASKSYFLHESRLHQFLYQRFIATAQPSPKPIAYRTDAQFPSRVRAMVSMRHVISSGALTILLRALVSRIYIWTVKVAIRVGVSPWEYAGFLATSPKGGLNYVLRTARGLPNH